MIVRPVDRGRVGERAANGDDARSVGQRLDPFGHELLAGFGRGGGAPRFKAVVDEHVRRDVAGERIVGSAGRPFDDRPEGVEIAGVLGQPDPVGSQPLCVVILHGPFLRAFVDRAQWPIHFSSRKSPAGGLSTVHPGGEGESGRAMDEAVKLASENALALRARAARSSFRRHGPDRGESFVRLRRCFSSTVAAETPPSQAENTERRREV